MDQSPSPLHSGGIDEAALAAYVSRIDEEVAKTGGVPIQDGPSSYQPLWMECFAPSRRIDDPVTARRETIGKAVGAFGVAVAGLFMGEDIVRYRDLIPPYQLLVVATTTLLGLYAGWQAGSFLGFLSSPAPARR